MSMEGNSDEGEISVDDAPTRNLRSNRSQGAGTTQTSNGSARVLVVRATQAGSGGGKGRTGGGGPGNAGQLVQAAFPKKPIVMHPPANGTTTSSAVTQCLILTQDNINSHTETTRSSVQEGVQGPTQIIIRQQGTTTPTSSSANGPSVVPSVGQTITVTVAEADGREGLYAGGLQYVSGDGGTGGLAVNPHMDTYTSANPTHLPRPIQPGTYVYPAEGAYSPYYTSYNPAGIHSPGGGHPTAYVLSPGQSSHQHSPNSEEGDTHSLTSTTRASPATIQWLLQNYETAEGVSLPRCTLYNHYLRHCSDNKLDPVNAASFGKLIRSVFLGLRTRRLGTRGNSKYHYYGIRIKPESPLNRISEGDIPMAMRQQPSHPNRRPKPPPRNPQPVEFSSGGSGIVGNSGTVPTAGNNPSSASTPTNHGGGSVGGMGGVVNDQHIKCLGDGQVPDIPLPTSPQLDEVLQSMGLNMDHLLRLYKGYRLHCERILSSIKRLQFNDVENIWRSYWQPEDLDTSDEDLLHSGQEKGLTQTELFSLCTIPQVQSYIQATDFAFYQVIVDILIPSVLNPIPSQLTQQIRNFAKNLESGLGTALDGAPDVIQRLKLAAVNSLAQTLRRYTSLNHLAQAARAVLTNSQQITQMLADLNRVDFRNVQEQASWVCRCDSNLVEQLEKDFKATLAKQKSLEEWAEWLERVVDLCLAPFHDKPLHRIATAAKQFLLIWSFYSSMVIRDLTLRSAASFGSFHLIRLLYDEYMFYLVEQRLARSTEQGSIAVMTQLHHSGFMSEGEMSGSEGHFSMSGMELSYSANHLPPLHSVSVSLESPKFNGQHSHEVHTSQASGAHQVLLLGSGDALEQATAEIDILGHDNPVENVSSRGGDSLKTKLELFQEESNEPDSKVQRVE